MSRMIRTVSPPPALSLAAALVLVLVAALALVPVPATTASARSPEAGTWAVRGTMSDACQCQVFCPCELAEKPTFGHCKDTAIIHVEEGHFGPVDLSGQRIVVVSQSPDDERLVDSVGRLLFAHMYVPDDASDEQAEALGELARRIFGTWVDQRNVRISLVETVERVPMQVTIEPHRHRVKIPRVLDLDIKALTGTDGVNPVALTNAPANAPGMGDLLVARSHAYRFTDHDIDWDFPGRSGSIRSLDLSGEVAAEPAAVELAEPAGEEEGGATPGHRHGDAHAHLH